MAASTIKNLKVTVQGVKSPVPAVLGSEQAGSRPSISNDCNDTRVVHLANVSDNTTSKTDSPAINPFRPGSKLVRTPEKISLMTRAERSRSSPPVLNENTPPVKSAQAERDYLSELGENINKLSELMRLPQRSINNSMRDLLSSISKLHARAKEENTKLRNKASQNLVTAKMAAEATPKRPCEDNSTRRKTPPKKSKISHELARKEGVIQLCNKEDKSPSKTERIETPRDENWVKVKYKNKEKNKKKTKPLPRPDAIVIAKTGGMSYSDILRAVKKDASLQQLGENVSRIRKTAKGEILLQLMRAQTGCAREYKEGIAKLLGDQAEVKALTHELILQIRDLDEITTKDDIVDAIRSQIKDLSNFSESSIKNLRPAYAGTQTADISLPALEAGHLLGAEKIKIGWVVCRIREKLNLKKCYRCLEYGHVAGKCTNSEDRSECCMKCGGKGHFAKTCEKEPFCTACNKAGRLNIKHQIGGRKCAIYQAACKAKKKMRVIQINLNHCREAQDLLTQMMYEEDADVAVICEQHKQPDSGTWVSDTTRKAAIWVLGNKTVQNRPLADKTYYTRVKISGVNIYSCYTPPSLPQAAYEKIIDELVEEALTTTPNLIAGDFNAWALEWGSRCTNQRGKALLRALSLLDVVLLNTGRKNTFEKNGRGSIIDIAFISRSLAARTNWRICDAYTHSDHLAIIIDIKEQKQSQGKDKPVKKAQTKGWKTQTMDEEIFRLMLNAHSTSTNDANEQAQLLVARLTKACDAAMIRKKFTYVRKPAYWWNSDIAELRSACLKARRQYQRSRETLGSERLREIFKTKRKGLKNAIKKSKSSCFKELCAKADENPWGGAYKLVMSKLRGCKGQVPTCPALLKNVVETLFPMQENEQKYRLSTNALVIQDVLYLQSLK